MNRYVNNIDREGIIERCREYLETNDDFADEYGKIISFETKGKFPPTEVKKQG